MSNWRYLLTVVLLGVTTYSLLTWNSHISTFDLSVLQNGEMALEGAPLSLSELRQHIEAALADGNRVVVNIQASPDIPAGYVVDVMNAAEAAGATEVNIEAKTSGATAGPGRTQ